MSDASRPESQIQRLILAFLRHLPSCWAVKYPGAIVRGVPDLIGSYHGRFFALEVKRPGGKATPLQLATMRAIQAAGGVTAVVHSVVEVQTIMETIAVEHHARRLGCAH